MAALHIRKAERGKEVGYAFVGTPFQEEERDFADKQGSDDEQGVVYKERDVVFFENAAGNQEFLVDEENECRGNQGNVESDDAPRVNLGRSDVGGVEVGGEREQENEKPDQEKRHEGGDGVVEGLLFFAEEVVDDLLATPETCFLHAFERPALGLDEVCNGFCGSFYGHTSKIKSKNAFWKGVCDIFMTKMRKKATKNQFNFCERLSR